MPAGARMAMAVAPEAHLFGLVRAAWRAPLARMLLLSAGLHLALAMIVQPRPFPPVTAAVALHARLLEKPVTPTRPARAPVSPPGPAPTDLAVSPSMPAPTEPAASESVALPRPSQAADLPSVPVMVDDHWYEARQLDALPRATLPIAPVYPAAARRAGVEGTVRLRLRIDEFGGVRDIEVVAAQPPGVFEESALAALRQARFLPAHRDGRPVRALITMPVRYRLDD